jgi:hypothetical protein
MSRPTELVPRQSTFAVSPYSSRHCGGGREPAWTEQRQYGCGYIGPRNHTVRIASYALALVALTTPLIATAGAEAVPPQGWVAHSAFGLQLSVPKLWGVAYFQNCPLRKFGTLLIGTPADQSFCAHIPADANIISMLPQQSGSTLSGRVRHLVVHGLGVISYSTGAAPSSQTQWVVPSKQVVLTATGAQSSAVLRTLTIATSRALPAPGMLRGSVHLIGPTRTPVTGPVSVTRLGPHGSGSTTVEAYNAEFSDTFPPGNYLLTGHAGDAPCPPVVATVRSGETTDAPEIDCQGQ